MKNIIDVSNHIMLYSNIYCEGEEVTEECLEAALNLILEHGEDFVFNFVKNYLNLEERYECH